MSNDGFTLLIAICLIAVVIGNGSFFVDDPRNSALPFFRLIGIIGDVLLVYCGAAAFTKSKKKKQMRNEIAETQSRIAETAKEISKIKEKYECKVIPYIPRGNFVKTPINFKMIYTDVDSTAHAFFAEQDKDFKQISLLSSRITSILDNHFCKEETSDAKKQVVQTEEQQISVLEGKLNSLDKQLSYLTKHISELEEHTQKMRSLLDSIRSKKIVLNEPNNQSFIPFKESLLAVKQSKKIFSYGDVSAKDFFNPSAPEDLSFFSSPFSPLLVSIRPFTYAIFPSVILCFDTNGLFSTALAIDALSLTISRNQEHVFVFNESFNSQHTSIDSTVIERGAEKTRWEYACRDGTPDLRYKSNRQITSRRDTLEYGELSLSIENHQFCCGFSSSQALSMVESSYPVFCAMINQSKQPKAVALLRLLSVLEIDNEALDQIRRAYYEQVGGKPYCLID